MSVASSSARATVVGSGPNGLAAAVVLARAGLEVTVLEASEHIGGGTRSGPGLVDGLIHDHCSAVHPLAAGSPLLESLELERHGLLWRRPEIDCAHPLDDGGAAALYQDVATTAAHLGHDGRRWSQLFEAPARRFDDLRHDVMGPLISIPRRPLGLARFGIPALAPATMLARLFRDDATQALWAGVAAHAFTPLSGPLSSSIGLGIITAGHRYGWTVAQGGSQAIADALVAELVAHGGRVETGVTVRSVADVAGSAITIWDLAPPAVARILGDRMPGRIERAFREFRFGPGAFKVDFAVQGGVPWTAAQCRGAGTVHLGGTLREVVAAEAEINAGRMPQRPFVLVGQQYLADPTRSAGDIHPVWAYAHVPKDYTGDATDAIISQIERFAPGFRDHIVARSVTTPGGFMADNANFVGGNILTGAKDIRQLIGGPRLTWHPYDTGLGGHYICSAATPPGPGAHGMSGFHAAKRALAHTLSIPVKL